jgi:hypothetical protein
MAPDRLGAEPQVVMQGQQGKGQIVTSVETDLLNSLLPTPRATLKQEIEDGW